MKPEELEEKIRTAIPGATVKARDLTGGGDHWQVDVTASQFSGLSMVQQHQMIYKALGTWMKKEIHALAINAKPA
jgi:stress-induced morphogen